MRYAIFFSSNLLMLVAVLSGCGNKQEVQITGSGFRPINEDAAVFWDRQTTESAELLRTMAEEFNQQWQGLHLSGTRWYYSIF